MSQAKKKKYSTLEKQGRIRIIRSQESGSPVKFLERIA